MKLELSEETKKYIQWITLCEENGFDWRRYEKWTNDEPKIEPGRSPDFYPDKVKLELLLSAPNRAFIDGLILNHLEEEMKKVGIEKIKRKWQIQQQ